MASMDEEEVPPERAHHALNLRVFHRSSFQLPDVVSRLKTAPLISVEKVEVLDHHQVVSFLSGIETTGLKTKGTLHIARLDENGEELSRGFVVFPQWLNDVDSQ